jgi:membrane-bound serine protease (ClpP class)
MLSLGGLISLTLGSIMLFESVRVSLKLMLPTVALVGGFFVIVAALAFRAYRSKPKSGKEGLIGEVGVVKEKLAPEGLVFVHGEYWRATADEPIEEDEKIRVIAMDGLTLKVRKNTGEEGKA